MPQTTMRHEDEYPVPAGIPLPAVLNAVTERVIEFVRKDDNYDGSKKKGDKDSFTKWKWEFKVTDGEYAGMKLYGETEDRLTNREDNLVRQWSETLLNATIEVGQGLNTDDLIGLPCIVTVRHEEPREKRDGGKFYPCPVDEVFPASSSAPGF